MSKYRGFRGQVTPINNAGLSGLGWYSKAPYLTAEQAARFPDALFFCGSKEYQAYIQKYGSVPPGSSIIAEPWQDPKCAAVIETKQLYPAGANILMDPVVTLTPEAYAQPVPEPYVAPTPAKISPPAWLQEPAPTIDPDFPVMPPGTDPEQWAFDLWRTGYTDVDPRIAAPAPGEPYLPIPDEQAAFRGELEARQYAPDGDGIAPTLELRAAAEAAARRAIDAGEMPPGVVPDEAPNWGPLLLAAALIFLMQG